MSLREFLNVLHEAGDLASFSNEMDPKYEIASVIRRSCDDDGPAIEVFPGEGYCTSVVVGSVYGAKRRILRILDPTYGDYYFDKPDVKAVERYVKCADIKEGEPLKAYLETFSFSTDPPCQEIVNEGSSIDLYKLPICTHNEKDVGPFITAGVNVVKWIDGVTHGLGIHRMNVIGRNHLSCLAPPNRRVGFPHYEASKKGKGIKMAVVIGAPPEVVLASQAKVNFRTEKYNIASNLRGKKISLTKCLTSDIMVPSESELVLECTSIPDSFHDDTPFAEYPGTYSVRSNAWVCKVDAITYRRDFIYQTILTGKTPQEDSNLCAFPYAAEVYKQASHVVEKVTDISAFIGNNVFDTLLCVKKNSNEEIENLMHILLGNRYLKSVAIMDDDMKADEESWRFCFNTRYQPNRDTIITNLGLGASLDPSSPLFQSTSKIAMDLTIPTGKTYADKMYNEMRHKVATTHPDIKVLVNWEEKLCEIINRIKED